MGRLAGGNRVSGFSSFESGLGILYRAWAGSRGWRPEAEAGVGTVDLGAITPRDDQSFSAGEKGLCGG